MEEEHEMSSLRARRKKSSVGLSCCFNGTKQHRRRASFDAAASSSSPIPFSGSPRRSPSNWIKSKTNDLPEIKDKCRSLFSRMSRHRRHSSADFSYDPLSYALNFNDDDQAFDDDFCAKNFSSRLPVSPPTRTRTFDSHPPRMPRSLPDSYCAVESRRKEDQSFTPKELAAAGNDELRRGFEALSVNMRKNNAKEGHGAAPPATKQRRNKGELSSPRTTMGQEVRRLEVEEVTSPARISSNHEILVQLC